MSDWYLPARTATGAQVFALRTELGKRKHRVTVLAPQSHTLHVRDRALHSVPALPFPGGRGFLIFPGLSQADHLIAQADVIHVHSTGPLGRWAGEQARIHNKPLIVSLYPETMRRDTLADPGLQALVSQAAATLVPTERIAQALSGVGIRRPILTVPPAIDAAFYERTQSHTVRDRLGLSAQTPLFVVNGRLESEQRHAIIIAAVAELKERPHLAILGTGKAEPQLRELVRSLNATDRIHMLGNVPHAQMPAYFSAAHAILTASPDDPAPMSLFEAQAAGCPVIAAETIAARELVRDHEDGFLVRSTRTGFTTALRHLLHRPAVQHRMSISARRAGKRFELATVTNRIEEAYALARSFVTTTR